MFDEDKVQVSWSGLSNELWGEVFARLRQLLLPYSHFAGITQQAGESKLYATRLVCRQFNDSFQQRPDLYSSITLKHNQFYPPCAAAVSSLELWIEQHHAAVRHVRVSCDTTYLEAALTALSSRGAGLTKVDLEIASNLAVTHLGAFTA